MTQWDDVRAAHARGEHFSWTNCPWCWAERNIGAVVSAAMVLCFVVILLVGPVWAGEGCDLKQSAQTPCYLKMREVMKLAEKYKGDLWSPFHITEYSYSGGYPLHKRCVTSACLQNELDDAKAKEKKEEERERGRKKWDAVLMECVQ